MMVTFVIAIGRHYGSSPPKTPTAASPSSTNSLPLPNGSSGVAGLPVPHQHGRSRRQDPSASQSRPRWGAFAAPADPPAARSVRCASGSHASPLDPEDPRSAGSHSAHTPTPASPPPGSGHPRHPPSLYG